MSFLIFKKLNNIPPSGYCFKDPDTKYKFENHKNLGELLTAVRTYRENNDLPAIDDLYYAVQDYMCLLPINKRGDYCRKVEHLQNITFKQFVTGGNYYLGSKIKKWFGIDSERGADIKVIEERRKTCSGCSFNIPLDNSYEANGIRGEIKAMMDKDYAHIQTEYDEGLGVCGICNCSVAYKSCIPDKDVADSVKSLPKISRDKFPQSREVSTDKNSDGKPFYCWQKRIFNKFYNK